MQLHEVDDLEVEELIKDLPFFNNEPATPEENLELYTEHLKYLENEENNTILYDPAEKKRRNYKYCKKKYGQDLADKMLHAKKKNNGRVRPEDYAEIMKRHDLKNVQKNVNSKSDQKVNGKEPFVMLENNVIRNERVRKTLKKSMMLYLYLRSYIIREKFKGDSLNLYKRFFLKGKLAASISIRKLAQELYMDEKTVSGYIQELSANRIIEIETISAGDAFDNQKHNVYVFGTHDSMKHETYYLNQAASGER